MESLHIAENVSGAVTPDASVAARVALFARSIIVTTGAVIDIVADAHRYDSCFVFRLKITGVGDKATACISNSAEAVADGAFYLLAQDSVDALVLLEALRVQLRLQSISFQAVPDAANGVGSFRAVMLLDVLRLHYAEIAYLEAERSRLAQWSRDNEGDSPGSLYDECAVRIEWHKELIARLSQITC